MALLSAEEGDTKVLPGSRLGWNGATWSGSSSYSGGSLPPESLMVFSLPAIHWIVNPVLARVPCTVPSRVRPGGWCSGLDAAGYKSRTISL